MSNSASTRGDHALGERQIIAAYIYICAQACRKCVFNKCGSGTESQQAPTMGSSYLDILEMRAPSVVSQLLREARVAALTTH